MKTNHIFIIILLTLCPLLVSAKNEQTVAVAREVVAVMLPEDAYQGLLDEMLKATLAQAPDMAHLAPVFEEFFSTYVTYEKMFDGMVAIYSDLFSISELRELRSFYQTPAGQKMARLLPELTQRGGALGESLVMQHQGELMRMIQESMAN